MDILDDREELLRLDQLIRLKATGTPKQLAEKFDVSISTIKRAIKKLRNKFDCPIQYSKIRRSYYYEYPGRLIIKFETINKEGLNKIKGGFLKKNISGSNFDPVSNYVCTENQMNWLSGFPTPNIKVGFKFL